MTPEKLEELEKLEAAATPGEWVHSDVITAALRNNARDLFAALREAWRERDEAREEFKSEVEALIYTANAAIKERDEARAALRMLWEEATDSERCANEASAGLYQHHISEPCCAAVKAVLGDE